MKMSFFWKLVAPFLIPTVLATAVSAKTKPSCEILKKGESKHNFECTIRYNKKLLLNMGLRDQAVCHVKNRHLGVFAFILVDDVFLRTLELTPIQNENSSKPEYQVKNAYVTAKRPANKGTGRITYQLPLEDSWQPAKAQDSVNVTCAPKRPSGP